MSDMWVKRDAEVVWHGFTQMSCYADNAPLIIERAEGHQLIDVDGNRYLDAISSLWVNTLGHHVTELDDAIRDQLDRVAHTTMLGNGNRVVIEFAEALRDVAPVDDGHILFEHPPVGRTPRIGGSPCPTRNVCRVARRSIRRSSSVTLSRWSSMKGARLLMLPGRSG